MPTYSGYWSDVARTPYSMPAPAHSTARSQIATWLLHRGSRADVAKINALLGAVPGAVATSQYTRVAPTNSVVVGKQRVEVVTEVNRATTAADVTDLLTNMVNLNHNLVFRPDKGGNSQIPRP
jgi:hypothetical protein